MRASASSKRGLPFRSSHLRKVSPQTLLTGQQELVSPSTEPTVSPINPPGPLKPATVSLPRVCMLWTHDDSFSSDEVLLNFSQFPEGTIIAGDLVYVLTQGPFFSLLTNSVPVRQISPVHDPNPENLSNIRISNPSGDRVRKLDLSKGKVPLSPNPHASETHLGRNKRHVFVAKATSPEQNLARPGLQVCHSQLSVQAHLRI